MKKTITLLLIVTLAFTFVSCSGKEGAKQKFEQTYTGCFDTLTIISGYEKSEQDFTGNFHKIIDQLKIYSKEYDIYNNYEGINNIKTINDNAGKEKIRVSKDIINLLKFSKEMYGKSRQKLNIAMGSVLVIWKKYRDDANNNGRISIPSPEELTEASQHTDINKLIINEEENTVFLEDPNMSLDVGAVAKGYASELLMDFCKKNNIDNYLINLGGNVRAVGVKPDGKPWKIGIADPLAPSSVIYNSKVYDATLVTSGDYERYYECNGKRYHHIIDPQTLYPSETFSSVTIYAEDSGIAEILSTTLFIVSLEEGKKILKDFSDVSVLWICKDGRVETFGEMSDLLQISN